MPTLLTLSIVNPEVPGASWQIEVQEEFHEVLEKLMPLSPPTSQLMNRQCVLYTTTDGERITIPPNIIASIKEILPVKTLD